MKEQEIDALILLLDDTDSEVYMHVQQKLISCGPGIIPRLESFTEQQLDKTVLTKISHIIKSIQFDEVCKRLSIWKKTDQQDILEPYLAISSYFETGLDEQKVKLALDKLKKAIWLEMNYNLTPLEEVNVFNHVFYSLQGFGANNQNLFDVNNNYIGNLLHSRKGNPISLGLLYLIVGRSLDMPVCGVNLPQHFILSYHTQQLEGTENEYEMRKSILFYINCLNKGIIFTRDDITLFLKRINIEAETRYYVPCSNAQIIELLINSILQSFELTNESDAAKIVMHFKSLIQ
ncbi:MAG: transglutaminase-like domain-containing protein [Bacteroidota bacterium]